MRTEFKMHKEIHTWRTGHLPAPARIARWGHFGAPVLLFPTAGGDFEEVERFHLIAALRPLIEAGRMKVYSVDGLPARVWLQGAHSFAHCSHFQNQYHTFIRADVVPYIRRDCHGDDSLEIIVAGAAFGAFNAVASLCRSPDVFRTAIAMSGTYELAAYAREGWDRGYGPCERDDAQLDRARSRFVLLATGEGDYERPAETQRLAATLKATGIPHRVDLWGRDHHHTWNAWRAMLPRYLSEYGFS
jgi:esterase/lipase superfamily enzyme